MLEAVEASQRPAIIVAFVVIVVFELWRRSLRRRAPSWIHVSTLALLAVVASGVVYTQWQLRHLNASLGATSGDDKPKVLADAISSAMRGTALAAVCAILAAIVLGIGSYLARRR